MTYTQYFLAEPLMLPLLCFVLGLIVGSFINVVAWRLPLMLQREWRTQCHDFLGLEQIDGTAPSAARFNLAIPGSHCPQCQHAIAPLDNIPLLSWLLLRGQCRHCHGRIAARYPLVELCSGLLAALVAAHFGFSWLTLAALLFTWSLLALTLIDLEHQLLPDDLTLPLLWLGLLVNALGGLTTLHSAVWGAAAGYGILWLVYWAFRLLTGKEGMGHGDFKLLAALGAWLGWQALPLIILLSSVVGAAVGIVLLVVRRQHRDTPLPFGPYLAASGFLALLWGAQIGSVFFAWMG